MRKSNTRFTTNTTPSTSRAFRNLTTMNTIRPPQTLGELWADDTGMSTVEYAIGTLGAAAFGALLIAIAKSDGVRDALMSIIQQALTLN